MQFFGKIVHFFLHLDAYIASVVQHFGHWAYIIFFAVIFCETGLVVTPVLPGDSLLFALGAFAGVGLLSFPVLLLSLIAAAILGDTLNYHLGLWIGKKVFHKNRRFLNPKNLEKAHAFYVKHGGKSIVLARFIPLLRTFVPFIAGISRMSYAHFISYNIIGAIMWVSLCLAAGFQFGHLPFVQKHFEIVLIGIIFVSLMPIFISGIKSFFRSKKNEA